MSAEALTNFIPPPLSEEAPIHRPVILSQNKDATVQTHPHGVMKVFTAENPREREHDVRREAAMLERLGELGVTPRLISWKGGRSVKRNGNTFSIRAETPHIIMEDAGISARDYIAGITDPMERAMTVIDIGIKAAGKLTLLQEDTDWTERIIHETVDTNKEPLSGEDVPRQRAEKIFYREPETFSVRVNRQGGEHMVPRRSMIHRNITPDNILVGDDGEVRFCGVGNAVDLNEANIKHQNEFRAAPAYLAPERRPGSGQTNWTDYNAKLDVYSLAKTLQTLIGTMDTSDPKFALLHATLSAATEESSVTRLNANILYEQLTLARDLARVIPSETTTIATETETVAPVIQLRTEKRPRRPVRRFVAAAAAAVAIWGSPSAQHAYEPQTHERTNPAEITALADPLRQTHPEMKGEISLRLGKNQTTRSTPERTIEVEAAPQPKPTPEVKPTKRKRIVALFERSKAKLRPQPKPSQETKKPSIPPTPAVSETPPAPTPSTVEPTPIPEQSLPPIQPSTTAAPTSPPTP